MSDLAVQYALGTELLSSMLHTRMGGAIQVKGWCSSVGLGAAASVAEWEFSIGMF